MQHLQQTIKNIKTKSGKARKKGKAVDLLGVLGSFEHNIKTKL